MVFLIFKKKKSFKELRVITLIFFQFLIQLRHKLLFYTTKFNRIGYIF